MNSNQMACNELSSISQLRLYQVGQSRTQSPLKGRKSLNYLSEDRMKNQCWNADSKLYNSLHEVADLNLSR